MSWKFTISKIWTVQRFLNIPRRQTLTKQRKFTQQIEAKIKAYAQRIFIAKPRTVACVCFLLKTIYVTLKKTTAQPRQLIQGKLPLRVFGKDTLAAT